MTVMFQKLTLDKWVSKSLFEFFITENCVVAHYEFKNSTLGKWILFLSRKCVSSLSCVSENMTLGSLFLFFWEVCLTKSCVISYHFPAGRCICNRLLDLDVHSSKKGRNLCIHAYICENHRHTKICTCIFTLVYSL